MAKQQGLQKEKIWTRDFIFICMANFFIFAGFQMTLPTLPLFVNELGGSDQLIGFVVGIFTLSALLIRPWSGHVLESLGRRIIFLIGLIVFVISVGSYAFTGSLILLFLMRVVQGLGWGMSTTAVGTIATDLIPQKRRGEGMGYFGLAGNLAMAFGPALGLFLIALSGFQTMFLIAASAGLLSFIIAAFIRYKPANKTPIERKKWDIFEKTALMPSILLFFITMVFGGIATFLPLYAEQLGIDGIEWYFVVFAVSLMLVRAFAGQIYDRKGHKAIFLPGAFLILLAMVDLTLLANQFMLILAAVLFGIGFGSVQPALQAWAVNEAPLHRKGMANATFFSFFDLGVGLGAMFFGLIASTFGYADIYLTAGISVIISMVIYVIYLKRSAAVHKHSEAVQWK
ncbi:MFS transporter [Alkalihalobacillus hwajinpoensis]|uniref:MFS transporter n=1 Tax=Guptibacillus hwajinpoensis TaxID=208199 RepID=UPI0018834D70|nr:MFS transporter [Pseudalkalibacillus hwajinpoensis]MBF0708736.1 MFS transporter [Pseudalkalibacillus hwajinpoensis]